MKNLTVSVNDRDVVNMKADVKADEKEKRGERSFRHYSLS